MWTHRTLDGGRPGASKFALERSGTTLAYRDVLASWSDADFAEWFCELLAASPYSAFKWETPSVTDATLDRTFECVLLDAPGLARAPEPSVFADHFHAEPNADVVAFENLGGDATLVVPRPLAQEAAYGHLAAFVRLAPATQRRELWRVVADAMHRRVCERPVWLSTAGGGVSWLHVRLDDRPKYYGFAAYRGA